MSAVIARSAVLSARVGSGAVPDSVIAAARDAASLRRLQRRIRWLSRLHLIR